MSWVIPIYDRLFDGGPPLRVQRSLGLIKPNHPQIVRRAALAALIGWAALALLVFAQFVLQQDAAAAKSFFTDFAAYGRFLIAAPCLILAERECIPHLGNIAHQFLDAGLIQEADRARFDRAVASTKRRLEASSVEFTTLVLAYVVAIGVAIYAPPQQFPAWHRVSSGGVLLLSWAGWWHTMVSLPLLLALLFGWLWRVLLWGRFLWLMARLRLQLIPAHPDGAGGLLFVSSSLRAFSLLTFAFGAFVAGTAANRIKHQGAALLDIKGIVIGLAVFVLVLFAGPLLVFLKHLRRAKWGGIFEYGALAGEVGQQFERKWCGPGHSIDEGALGVPDFSATVDLYGVAANVYQMNETPFGLKNLSYLIVPALLPFVPVVLLVIPLKEVVKELAKLLL